MIPNIEINDKKYNFSMSININFRELILICVKLTILFNKIIRNN